MSDDTRAPTWLYDDERMNDAVWDIALNAGENEHKTPTLDTLLEEVAELILSCRGKHEHPPRVGLVQIGGIVVNLLAQGTMEET